MIVSINCLFITICIKFVKLSTLDLIYSCTLIIGGRSRAAAASARPPPPPPPLIHGPKCGMQKRPDLFQNTFQVVGCKNSSKKCPLPPIPRLSIPGSITD